MIDEAKTRLENHVLKWAPILDGPATYANIITLKTADTYCRCIHTGLTKKSLSYKLCKVSK